MACWVCLGNSPEVCWADIAALGGEHPGPKTLICVTEGPLQMVISERSDAIILDCIPMKPLIVLQILDFR